jgi:hypothetical protein
MTNTDNVTSIESKQTAPSCHFSITATLQGFPVTIEGEGRAGDLKIIIDRLLSIGAEPPTTARPEPTKASGAPLCPVHNTPMKASQKPGTFFCSKKNDDGSYCREKA